MVAVELRVTFDGRLLLLSWLVSLTGCFAFGKDTICKEI
jgi:hypothetical protein